MTTLGSQNNILKEVYEKGKRVKSVNASPGGENDKIPPFMKNRKSSAGDDMKKAKTEAAQRRLAMMKKSGGK